MQADQFVITPESCPELLLAVGIGGLIDNVSDGSMVMTKFFGQRAFLFGFIQIVFYSDPIAFYPSAVCAERFLLCDQVLFISLYK